MLLLLQIIVVSCFIVVIIALFREKSDFLFYSMLAMLVAAAATFLLAPGVTTEDLFLAVDWEVIFFLVSIFTIVAILEEQRIFQEVARRITTKFSTNTRKFFWVICLISTISAAFIEDVSVAIIFIPMIISTSEKMKINPAPILMGMTICINLAATLTPFGSAQNILIANNFNLSSIWFFSNLSIYFILGTFLTLYLLDKFVLKKHIDDIWIPHCEENHEPLKEEHFEEHELVILEEPIEKKLFNRNIISLVVFFILLILINNILFVGLLSLLFFVFINPRLNAVGKKKPAISYYLKQVDFKLIFFFISLFVLVFSFDKAGIIDLLEIFVLSIIPSNLFLLSIMILVFTSLLSGLLDNIPVTVLFLPIINVLIQPPVEFASGPILIAFILGINLGGNFLPQGSAADMMTLELSKKYCADDLNYRRLFKVGGIFAVLHILLGVGYLAVMTFLFY
ncbi:MAG: SLC13 family permease [Candidatus Thorarchaeota archaeon]